MGFALGVVHMRLDDWARLTLQEYASVVKAWSEDRERSSREAWEQARLCGYAAVLPYSKNLTVHKFLPLPWDAQSAVEKREKSMTQEDRRKRMKAMFEKFGKTIPPHSANNSAKFGKNEQANQV